MVVVVYVAVGGTTTAGGGTTTAGGGATVVTVWVTAPAAIYESAVVLKGGKGGHTVIDTHAEWATDDWARCVGHKRGTALHAHERLAHESCMRKWDGRNRGEIRAEIQRKQGRNERRTRLTGAAGTVVVMVCV